MQEMSCAVQHNLPVKVFILNNEWMGMVRQWQQLLHGERYSHSYSEALPDFVKMAEAFGAKGIRCDDPALLDAAIQEMIDHPGPVLFDCRVTKDENCFPMIPSGAGHHEMLLGDDGRDLGTAIDDEGAAAGVMGAGDDMKPDIRRALRARRSSPLVAIAARLFWRCCTSTRTFSPAAVKPTAR
jgi:hypothetical protein